MKFSKAISLAMAGLLVPVFFAGCTPDNGGTPQIVNDLVYDSNGNVVYNGVELNMWSVTTGEDANTQDAIIAKFNETYNGLIKINTTHTSRYDLETNLDSTMQFDRANAPDLLFNHGSRSGEYAEKGWILPLEEYVEKADLLIDMDDYVESLIAATTYNDKLYGLPQDVHSAMVVYRKDILEKNNLSVPTNYQELVAVCEQAMDLAAAGELWIRGENSTGEAATAWRKAPTSVTYEPFPISFGDMWVHEFLGYTAAAQNGGTFVGEKGYPGWNTDEVANGLQVLRDFVMPSETSENKYALTKEYGGQFDVANASLRYGNCIFKLLGPWEYPNDLTDYNRLLSADGGSANIATMSLSNLFAKDPSQEYASKIKGEGHAFMLMSTATSLTKCCAAMVFADWMVNNAGIDWAKRGHLPSLKSVENSSEYRSAPEYEAYIKNWGSCDDYVVISSTTHYSYVDSYFKNCVKKAMSKQFATSTLKSIIKEEYDDCVDYIELYA